MATAKKTKKPARTEKPAPPSKAIDPVDAQVLATFSKRLGMAIKFLGITQLEAANRAGMQPPALSKILRSGDTGVRITYLFKLAEGLNVSSSWLIGETDSPTRLK